MYIVASLTFLFGALTTFIGIGLRLSAQDAGYGLEKYIDYSAMRNAEIVITIGSVVAIFAAVLLIIKIVKERQKKKRQLNTKKCIACGNIVDINQTFCNRCGSHLKLSATKASREEK